MGVDRFLFFCIHIRRCSLRIFFVLQDGVPTSMSSVLLFLLGPNCLGSAPAYAARPGWRGALMRLGWYQRMILCWSARYCSDRGGLKCELGSEHLSGSLDQSTRFLEPFRRGALGLLAQMQNLAYWIGNSILKERVGGRAHRIRFISVGIAVCWYVVRVINSHLWIIAQKSLSRPRRNLSSSKFKQLSRNT